MLRPTTLAVEKRASSTVKVRLSRITVTASSYPVTSQPSSASTQDTGSVARSRARTAAASASSSPRSTRAPTGNRSARDVTR